MPLFIACRVHGVRRSLHAAFVACGVRCVRRLLRAASIACGVDCVQRPLRRRMKMGTAPVGTVLIRDCPPSVPEPVPIFQESVTGERMKAFSYAQALICHNGLEGGHLYNPPFRKEGQGGI